LLNNKKPYQGEINGMPLLQGMADCCMLLNARLIDQADQRDLILLTIQDIIWREQIEAGG